MSNTVLNVFTAKPKEHILARGGSDAWVVSPRSMKGVEYCVCSRNDDPQFDIELGGARPEPRNQAFLVGRVSGLEFVEHINGRDRYCVLFSAYAEVAISNYRVGTVRSPVTYSKIDECLSRGLDLYSMEWKSMPEKDPGSAMKRKSASAGLSIAQAKEGLSIYFDVDVDAIQIIISA